MSSLYIEVDDPLKNILLDSASMFLAALVVDTSTLTFVFSFFGFCYLRCFVNNVLPLLFYFAFVGVYTLAL